MHGSRLTQALLTLIFLALVANLLARGGPRPAEAQFSFGLSQALVDAVKGISEATSRQAQALERLAEAVRGLQRANR
ncbi:MAG: hypothetical protein HYY96_02325 [Candidatus Tectomicrobia bacterium]|nr:hypothetical protein [Candidatus Tectomicrobia bacterium]